VVLMHELPGITPQCLELAERIIAAGFRVYLPHFFGTPGRRSIARGLIHICISREWYCLARRRSSPITAWLRALCRVAHRECGGAGVGAVGMCLSGNFALSLMVEPSVLAPVLSQPSLPLNHCCSSYRTRAALACSPAELEAAKQRARENVPLLGFRFSHDAVSPPERFTRLRQEFGDQFEGHEIDSGPDNPHGIPRTAHAVLTLHLVDREGHPTREALERILEFLQERLGGHAAGGSNR